MMQLPLLFSLLFFAAFTIYMFFGIYVILTNPKVALNKVFLAICLSLCFWSFGFSVANFAPDLETCLFWRRISAIGWGTIYSLLLHYALLLRDGDCSGARRKLCFLLHLPAMVTVYVFALSGELTVAQYNLVKMDYGWINVSVQNGWNTFFHIYYVGYVLATLGIIWNWRQRSEDLLTRKLANLFFIAIAAALILGSITDVFLSMAMKGPVPQMAPVFILLPVGVIYYSMKHHSMMVMDTISEDELILSDEARRKLYYYLTYAFLAGGIVSALAYYLQGLLQSEASLQSTLYASACFFFFSLLTLLVQLLKNNESKKTLIIMAMLFSIPIVTLQFLDYASITIWVFPVVLMLISLIFDSRLPLILLTTVAIITQGLVWLNAPKGTIYMDEFDYIVRVIIFLIIFFIGSFINRTYIKRLEENVDQINFQKLVSEISADFVSVNQNSIDEKAYDMLERIGCFFQVDRAYFFLIDHYNNSIGATYEWCSEGIPSGLSTIKSMPLDRSCWWLQQINSKNLLYIEDLRLLPESASKEKGELSKQGVKSLLLIPIEENEVKLGFLGLDSVTFVKKWSGHHIELLRIISNLLADALIRIDSEKAIEYMAYYDQLTGLPNRTLFSERLDQAIYQASRFNSYIGVILVDLDSFKVINDSMGYRGGDTILKEVAQGLQQYLQEADTFLARFGGDEFLVMVNNLAASGDASQVADTIMEMFAQPFILQGHEFLITASAGVAMYPYDGEDAETLLKNADVAMYEAKSRGKNQYVLCTAEMKEELRKNIELSNNLYRTWEKDELIVCYQPQISLSTGKIVGVESLLRWKHPELGIVPPAVFIPLAEKNGTINDIGEWVLKTAIRQNRKWQEMGYPHLRVAVNLSIVQFNNPALVGLVERELMETGLDPEHLDLEITESIASKEAGHVIDALGRLKKLGVSISIDDFGTEYSSLNRLKTLPIDRLKIDTQFVQGIEDSEKDQAIINIIINLAKTLGLEVLAEGVETVHQLEFLKQRNCDDVQGYYFYKPMSPEGIEELFT